MNNQLFRQLEPHIAAKNKRIPSPNSKGWIGPIRAPHRADKDPSFSILPDDHDTAGAFIDHASGESGSLVDLLRLMGIEPAPIDRDRPIGFPTWARARKIDPDRVTRAFGIRQVRDGLIQFPTPCGVDRLRGISWGKSEPRWAKSGGTCCAYGLEQAKKHPGPIYLVEGEPSVWACWQSGVAAVCGLVGAGQSIAALVEPLRATGRDIRIAYDIDAPGKQGAEKAAKELRAAGIACQIVDLPADLGEGGDVDDLHRRTGDTGLALALRECPIRVKLPPGYYIGPTGFLLREAKDEKSEPVFVCETVVSISRVMVDVHSYEETWRITWGDRYIDVNREHAAVPRELVKYSARGLPVNTGNASALMRYLHEYELYRRKHIPRDRCARNAGWHKTETGWGYLYGTTGYGASPMLHEHGDGTDTLIRSLHTAGDFTKWREAIREACKYRSVRLCIASAVAPLFLERMGLEGWCVDICGVTSTGKTSAASVAASVAGDPSKLRLSWSATKVGLETAAFALSGAPLILDDTKDASHPSVVADSVYMVVNGQGKQRGSRTGRRETMRFSTVMISTGEGPIADFAAGSGGLRARCLQIWGSPWGRKDAEMARTITRMISTLRKNYGWGLARLAAAAVEWGEADWEILIKDHGEITNRIMNEIRDMYPERSPTERTGKYLATIAIAGRMLDAVCDLRIADPWVDSVSIEQIAAAAVESDRSREALLDIVSFLGENPGRLYMPGASADARELIGAMRSDGTTEMLTEVTITSRVCRDQLRRMEYDASAVVAAWKDHGWIDEKTSRRATGRPAKCIELTPVGLRVADAVSQDT